MKKETNKKMDKQMDKQVIGATMINGSMANYNADFSGRPRTTSDGIIMASGFCNKALTKNNFEAMFPKEVFGKRTFKIIKTQDDNITYHAQTFIERYEEMFGVKIVNSKNSDKKSDEKEILSNLLKMRDVRNFGLVIPIPKMNRSITGVAQINDALDLTEDNRSETHINTSSFSSDDSNVASTVGNYSITKESHYLHPFEIVPNTLKSFVEEEITTPYTEKDYEELKSAMLTCATNAHSRSKSSCYNEFAVFIEMETKATRIDLRSSIKFEKVENNRNRVYLNAKSWVPEIRKQIFKIEVYVEPDTIEFCTDVKEFVDDFKVYDIRTNKDITKEVFA